MREIGITVFFLTIAECFCRPTPLVRRNNKMSDIKFATRVVETLYLVDPTFYFLSDKGMCGNDLITTAEYFCMN